MGPRTLQWLPLLSAVLMLSLTGCDTTHPERDTRETQAHLGADASPYSPEERLAQQIFPLAWEMEQQTAVHTALRNDRFFQDLEAQRRAAIEDALERCEDLACLLAPLFFETDERKAIQRRLIQLYNHPEDTVFKSFLTEVIQPKKAYIFYDRQSGGAQLAAAWKDQHNGINYILRGYGLNQGLRYPKVDAPIHDVHSEDYFETVRHAIQEVLTRDGPLFFTPALYTATRLLVLNERDEAIRFRPLSTVNHAAYERMRTIDWDAAPYSAILVFGKGPKRHGVALSRAGRQNLDRGVELFREGKAPFLVVSGGNVHPNRTPFNEAEEMKRYLMQKHDIPEHAILMEPHARHTTTNIQNMNRILLSHGAPDDKPIVGVSQKEHINYISSPRFLHAYTRDIRFNTLHSLKRLSPHTVEFWPTWNSFHVLATEPLDP